jgi:hypothetical protein
MQIRRFFHVLAIMFSSLVALIPHGQAQADAAKKLKKSGTSSLSKSHGDDSDGDSAADGSDDPPRKISTSLMASAVRSFAIPLHFSAPTPSDAHVENTRYPWKRKIVTTTFWIGEMPTKNNPVPNRASSWDAHWAENYGGFDNPNSGKRHDFIPVKFTPRQNPFYVALPYNDLQKNGHKPEAARVIPWFKDAYQGPGKTVCKGRWIAIRFNNKVAYAQWEDAGPFRTDHWEYVFGNERPKPNLNHGAGLDVSPAVRDYLGMNDTDVTDWRFVDFDEVPQGPWAKHGDNNTFVINKRKAAAPKLAQAENTGLPLVE